MVSKIIQILDWAYGTFVSATVLDILLVNVDVLPDVDLSTRWITAITGVCYAAVRLVIICQRHRMDINHRKEELVRKKIENSNLRKNK